MLILIARKKNKGINKTKRNSPPLLAGLLCAVKNPKVKLKHVRLDPFVAG
jgi:hypothetical protein